jgi:hypothetical protein
VLRFDVDFHNADCPNVDETIKTSTF